MAAPILPPQNCNLLSAVFAMLVSNTVRLKLFRPVQVNLTIPAIDRGCVGEYRTPVPRAVHILAVSRRDPGYLDSRPCDKARWCRSGRGPCLRDRLLR